MTKRIHSMTGFSQVEGAVAGARLRMEIKTLNHRFLDLKVRLPRELSSAEVPLRAALSARFSRGAVEVKLDRVADPVSEAPAAQVNVELAKGYYGALIHLQRELGIKEPVRIADLLSLPEVVTRGQGEVALEDAWAVLEPIATEALDRLAAMRAHEGGALARSLERTLDELDSKIELFRKRRVEMDEHIRGRIKDKVRGVFEAYPITGPSIEAVLESRIAQELAMILDRTDIEEELTRFKGHLGHFRKVLNEGGPVGKKLDFLLQELNREINTMSNKAQDLALSEETVSVKVRIEQLREQVMNLE